MKRDLELFRQILEHVERHPDIYVGLSGIDGVPDRDFAYHLLLLGDSGLLDLTKSYKGIPFDAVDLWRFDNRVRLTNQGHDFLGAARRDGPWKSALRRIGGPLASIPFEVFRDILIEEVKRQVGLAA